MGRWLTTAADSPCNLLVHMARRLALLSGVRELPFTVWSWRFVKFIAGIAAEPATSEVDEVCDYLVGKNGFRYVAADIFLRSRCDARRAIPVLKEAFKPNTMQTTESKRGSVI